MKTSKRFNNAISALVKGYMNNTLRKGTCTTCAVGNIVAASLGVEVDVSDNEQFDKYGEWSNVFVTLDNGEQRIRLEYYQGAPKYEIDATGYTVSELIRVESAFESNTFIHNDNYKLHTMDEIEEDQYRGLMAVLDVLCDIEGIEDPTPYKKMFIKPERV